MKEFTVELLIRLSVGAASGLHFFGNDLFIISDNSSFLYRYEFSNKKVTEIPLTENSLHLIPKSEKPDFEAIAEDDGKLYIFGSGSTSDRHLCVVTDIKNLESTTFRLDFLYQKMRETSKIGRLDMNIEGAVFTDKNLMLFQRGNGPGSQNGVFVIDKVSAFTDSPQILYKAVKLPMIDGIQSTFTDATMVDGTLYYLATAETSASTYLDGEVAGSLLGTLDKNLNPDEFIIIGKQKFEGIALYDNSEGSVSFIICEDNDSDVSEAGIYLLRIRK